MRAPLMLALMPLLTFCGRTEEPPGVSTAEVAKSVSQRRDSSVQQDSSLLPAASSQASPVASAEGATSPPAPDACVIPWGAAPAQPSKAAAACPSPDRELPRLARGSVVFSDAPGRPTVTVELTQTAEERNIGLMFRRALSNDAGMLFSWPADGVRSFWMRNTCIPLDMLFISVDGTISGILEQVPPMNEESRSIPCPVRHVLELNAGWSRSHGIAPGQRVEISQ